MKKRYNKILISFVIGAVLTTGCGRMAKLSFDAPQAGSAGEEMTTLGLTPEFNYEVPESRPSILVDQVGYAKGSDKVAILWERSFRRSSP